MKLNYFTESTGGCEYLELPMAQKMAQQMAQPPTMTMAKDGLLDPSESPRSVLASAGRANEKMRFSNLRNRLEVHSGSHGKDRLHPS